MEIKFQLDATDDIYCRFYFFLNMFRGTIMPIIRSSRLLYRWSLPEVFGALVFKLSVWCGAEGYVSCLQAVACKPIVLKFYLPFCLLVYNLIFLLICFLYLCFV